jgi:Leucine-rich repeat (LRR) protein/tRNA A-37 threonylcarbamoyl transferase component Bud32
MAESSPSPGDSLIGRTVAGRYRVISKLGEGGMGLTYRAWDEAEGRPVVLKMPRRNLVENAAFLERFSREVRMMAALSHPSIVPILDVGEDDGLPILVMRFLPGGSLSNRRLRDTEGKVQPMQPSTLQLWLPAVASALDFVHANGIVHRDVKPANIFFDAFWGAYLGDFGIAKIVEDTTVLEKEHTLTATSMAIGTQEYMAPEQFTPKAVVDGRVDQYALAVMVYEILVGQRPFRGETAHLVVEVTTQPVPRLTQFRRDLPDSVCQAVYRGLSKMPGERFASCAEFAAAVLRDVRPMADEEGVARLLCPQCGNMLKMPTRAAGRQGKCPRCKAEMMVAEDLGALWLAREEHEGEEQAAAGVGEQESGVDSVDVFTSISNTTPLPKAGVRGIWSQLDPTVRRVGIGAAMLASLVAAALLAGDYAAANTRKQLDAEQAKQRKLLAENESLKRDMEIVADEQRGRGRSGRSAPSPRPVTKPLRRAKPSMTVEELQGKLKAANPEYDGSGRIDFVNGKIVEVHLGNKRIADISPLNGLPLGVVALERTQVKDLSPLAGMPLRWLNLNDSPGVVDIAPLKGAPLAELHMARTGVTELEPLRGMRLRRLDLEGTKVQELGPLQGMPLEWLNLNFVSSYPSFAPLKGMPLRELHAHGTSVDDVGPLAGTSLVILNLNHAERIKDIRPLRGLPLRNLAIQATKISDLRPLEGMPLRWLDAQGASMASLVGLENTSLVWLNIATTAVKDVAPLKGVPLEHLILNGLSDLENLGPLAGMPLIELHLHGTKVSNLQPLKGMPLRVLHLEQTAVAEADLLSSLPLHHLNLKNTPAENYALKPTMNVDELQAKLKAANPEYDGSGRIDFINGRIVEVHLGNKRIADIRPLKGLPLGAVSLEQTQVKDLSPLAGMPLRWLNLNDSHGVVDIAPLRGMPLADLHMVRTGVTDLGPLRGMPLKRLNLEGTKVKDLGPLEGMPLEWLNLHFVNTYPSFAPLKGMPLRELHSHGTSVDDLGGLAGMPLQVLNINSSFWINDLSGIRGLPLRNLYINGTSVSDLRPLEGMPIRHLDAGKTTVYSLSGLQKAPLNWLSLEETAVDDLAALKGLPLEFLNLNHAINLSDLAPLTGMSLGELHVYSAAVSKIDVLRGMPLHRLNLEGTFINDASVVESLPLHYLNLKRTPFVDWGTDR